MSRRAFLVMLAAIAAAAFVAGFLVSLRRASGRAGADLNVVLISMDTVRADHVGCYGYGRDTSPNLDRLAQRGVLYTNASAQAPWTLVSHMSVFTSLLPSSHKVESINQRLSKDVPLMAQMLRGAGWQTAAFVNNGQMKPHWGFDRGFDLWREFEVLTPDGLTADEGRAENITSEVIRWLRERAQRRERGKFFLFVHYFDAHDPYDPPAPYDSQFAPEHDIELKGAETAALLQQYRAPGRELPDERLLAKLISLYDGEIRYNDEHLGRLLDALASLKLTERTLIVVFSDHGEEFKEHGSLIHGGTLYEEALHVPLVFSCPGHLPEGVRTAQPARLIDVLPTILHVCGLPPYAQAQGRSLVPVEFNAARYGETDVRAETKALIEGTALKSLRIGPLKYIYSPITGREELYDLAKDSAERKDLAAGFPALAQWRGEMARWMNRTEDYWMLTLLPGAQYATFSGTLELEGGIFGVVVPAGFDVLGQDSLAFSEELNRVSFSAGVSERPKRFFFQIVPDDRPVKFELRIDEAAASTESILIGPHAAHPQSMPFVTDLADRVEPPLRIDQRDDASSKVTGPAVRVQRFRSSAKLRGPQPPDEQRALDKDLIRQLRQLGYMQ